MAPEETLGRLAVGLRVGVGLFAAVLLACAANADVPEWNALGDRTATCAFFAEHEFGVRPVERPSCLTFAPDEPDVIMMDGAAVRKRVRITYGGKYGTNSFVVTAFVPRKDAPVPAFLLICNSKPSVRTDHTRRVKDGFWPAEEIVRRGYAAITFFNGDVAPDRNTDNTVGVFECFDNVRCGMRPLNRWGTISAWAWGASRVMDWIETEPTLDARRVAVVGHSRGGKTALWTAATDMRFAMACVNNSGCSGAKLNRMDLPKSEHVVDIVKRFPYWFCPRYRESVNREAEMPWDQHQLLATVAPRLLCVASATEDHWAGQRGEFESCRLASPAWEVQGAKGLGTNEFPPPDRPIQLGDVSYHLRTGKHGLTSYDWGVYMDFADKHGWTEKR